MQVLFRGAGVEIRAMPSEQLQTVHANMRRGYLGTQLSASASNTRLPATGVPRLLATGAALTLVETAAIAAAAAAAAAASAQPPPQRPATHACVITQPLSLHAETAI